MSSIREYIKEVSELLPLHYRLSMLLNGAEKTRLISRLNTISRHVNCPHNDSELLAFGIDLLALPRDLEGCVVEAGAFKGGSSAKISLFAKLANRPLIIFDSFEGLPENCENHEYSIKGHSIKNWFAGGEFCGSLEEVKKNISDYGEKDVCSFIKGWFDETMPNFSRKIAALYLDVDLASSTRTCLKYLYPLVVSGGFIYSQDGDFPLVMDVFNDENFWKNEIMVDKPEVIGLGKKKLIKIIKD